MWLNPSLKWMKLSYFLLEWRKIFDITQLWSSATTSSCCWQLVAAAADLRNRSLLLRDLRNCSLSLRDRNKSSKPCDRFEVAPSTKIARWKFEKIGSSHQNGIDFPNCLLLKYFVRNMDRKLVNAKAMQLESKPKKIWKCGRREILRLAFSFQVRLGSCKWWVLFLRSGEDHYQQVRLPSDEDDCDVDDSDGGGDDDD